MSLRLSAILVLFILMFFGFIRADALSASAPSLLKTWSYGNSSGGEDLTVDSLANMTIVGSVNGDALLLRYNASGSLLLQRIWGGSPSDYATGVTVDASGNAYLTGTTNSFGAGDFDIFFVKFSPAGNLLWQVTWGGSGGDQSGGATTDSSGGVIISGVIQNITSPGVTPDPPGDGVLLRFNSSGSLLWQVAWTGDASFYGRVLEDSSGDIYTVSSGNLLKFNSTGSLIWARGWSGMTGGTFPPTIPADISLDGSGNIYLAGIGYSGSSSVYLLKISPDGILLWQRRWQISGWGTVQSGYGMTDGGVTANATGIVYVTAVMSTCLYSYRGCTPYYEPLILEFDSTGSLLGTLAFQGGWELGRPSTDSVGNLYLTGGGGIAGLSFCTPAGELTTPSVSLTTPTGQVVTTAYSAMPASGTVNTPVGNETSQSGVFLMKFDPGITGGSQTCSLPVTVFPLTLPFVTFVGLLIILQARRRLHRPLNAGS